MNKFLICGLGRHGKDTVCEWLRSHRGLRFGSSSEFACKNVVYPVLKQLYGYDTPEECFNDRHAHRQEWFNIICTYNNEDRARLATEIMKEYDIYCGMRSKMELEASRHLFERIYWVDATDRLGVTERVSCTITKDMCDKVIENNGSLADLYEKLNKIF